MIPGMEGCRPGLDRAGGHKLIVQAKVFQDLQSAAADELAAHPVPGVGARFTDRHRHVTLPQRDAQSQTCQAAPDDGDWML
jgi:hypothetical protein